MLSRIQRYFNLSTREKRGLWSVSLLLFVIVVGGRFLYLFISPSNDVLAVNLQDSIVVWQSQLEENRQYDPKKYNIQPVGADESINDQNFAPAPFDPNTVGKSDFLKLGFSDKQCQSLMKWRQKGGRFYYREDFKKLYFVSEDIYLIFESFIQLPSKTDQTKDLKNHNKSKQIVIVELNSADSTELEALPAIGPALARRIIFYRTRLGGFIDHQQLLEVKGIDSTNFETIKKYTSVNAYAVRKININQAGIKDLSRHPYIGYNIALSLVNYRKNHGNYKVISEIKNSLLITDENYSRISPYLTIY